MHLSLTSVVIALCGFSAAEAQVLPILPKPVTSAKPGAASIPIVEDVAPALPVSDFENTPKFARPLTLSEAQGGVNATVTTIRDNVDQLKKMIPSLVFPSWTTLLPKLPLRDLPENVKARERKKRQSTCSNPRVRVEWDNYPDADKQAYINAIKCLQSRPSAGGRGASRSRYEDLVYLHQQYTPVVHGNAKFLLWHRYYLWTFEDVLRRECGFVRPLPWFDEARYAGRFGASSIFSPQWLGTFAAGGNCVRNGQFSNLTINIGPGSRNVRHCLSRNGQESKTANTNQQIVDACNGRPTYANMASCAEGAAHAWGHNGIGAVMQDTFAAPADPVFWLHHAYIDRNLAKWQSVSTQERTSTVGGTDEDGRRLTLNYPIEVGGIRGDTVIGNLLNTLSPSLCYRYDY